MAKKPLTDEQKKERREKREEMKKAIEIYEDLLHLADGGSAQNSLHTEFAATTILAMMQDADYYNKVVEAHEKEYG